MPGRQQQDFGGVLEYFLYDGHTGTVHLCLFLHSLRPLCGDDIELEL